MTETDGDLVQLVLDGNVDAFERLMRKYNALVFRTARAVLRSDAAAQDCAQQAWILAYDHLAQLTGTNGFAAWIARISYREALRAARQEQARGNVSLDAPGSSPEHAMLHVPTTPERETQRSELRERLESSIDELPDALREPFVLCEVQHLSVRETSELLGLTEENVRVRTHRARAALRDVLSADITPDAAFAFDGVRCDRMVSAVMQIVRSRAR